VDIETRDKFVSTYQRIAIARNILPSYSKLGSVSLLNQDIIGLLSGPLPREISAD